MIAPLRERYSIMEQIMSSMNWPVDALILAASRR
jgi:hypothetical protein